MGQPWAALCRVISTRVGPQEDAAAWVRRGCRISPALLASPSFAKKLNSPPWGAKKLMVLLAGQGLAAC